MTTKPQSSNLAGGLGILDSIIIDTVLYLYPDDTTIGMKLTNPSQYSSISFIFSYFENLPHPKYLIYIFLHQSVAEKGPDTNVLVEFDSRSKVGNNVENMAKFSIGKFAAIFRFRDNPLFDVDMV